MVKSGSLASECVFCPVCAKTAERGNCSLCLWIHVSQRLGHYFWYVVESYSMHQNYKSTHGKSHRVKSVNKLKQVLYFRNHMLVLFFFISFFIPWSYIWCPHESTVVEDEYWTGRRAWWHIFMLKLRLLLNFVRTLAYQMCHCCQG